MIDKIRPIKSSVYNLVLSHLITTVKQQFVFCWPCITVVYKLGHATDLWPCQLQVLSLWLEMRDETLQVWNHSYFRVHGNSHKSTHCSCALIENTKHTSGVLSFTLQKRWQPQFYIQLVFKAPLCITLKIKTRVAAYFFNFLWAKQNQKKIS